VGAGATLAMGTAGAAAAPKAPRDRRESPSQVRCPDGNALFVQDVGQGRPLVFVSAWTLDSRFWGSHIAALAAAGFRCVAIDRRGHGRSDAPSSGYDADTLASDLASVLEQRNLRDAVLIAHSIGGGESVRYLARHGEERVAKLVLVAPTTPCIVKSDDNPEGVPGAMVDAMLDEIARDFPQWVANNEAPFFVAETVPETRTWIKAMMLGVPLPIALTFRQQAGRTDFRPDVRAVRQPTLILHGDKDASAPLSLTGARTAKLMQDAKLVVYEGAPHALPLTHRDRFLTDLMNFARA
jgi:pimeloyl-ACP methyl ester carboxylesterase